MVKAVVVEEAIDRINRKAFGSRVEIMVDDEDDE
jgi:hypothetical protein